MPTIPLFPQIPHKTQRVYVYTHSVDPIDRANVSRASPHCSYVVSWKALRRRWQTPVIHPKCIFSVSNELLLWPSVVLRGSWGGAVFRFCWRPCPVSSLRGTGAGRLTYSHENSIREESLKGNAHCQGWAFHVVVLEYVLLGCCMLKAKSLRIH